MQPYHDALSATRREFLAQTGAVLGVATLPNAAQVAAEGSAAFEPVKVPDWIYGVTRMAFVTPGDVGRAAKAGAQVVHTNVVWPYFPLRRDGGGLSEGDGRRLRDLVADCRRGGVRLLPRPAALPAGRAGQATSRLARPSRRLRRRRETGAADENNLGTRRLLQQRPVGRLPHRSVRRA